jgi:hypothetical protein
MSTAVFAHEIINGTHVLIPCDADGSEMLSAMKVGKQCHVEVHTPRNPSHHRMMFLLMKRIIDAGAWDGDDESLLTWLKYATGHVETKVDHNGQVHYTPKSIKFSSLDQAGFRKFFDRAVWMMCNRLTHEEDWEAVRDEIIAIVDAPYRSQANHLARAS